jgi:Tfp pilus assembly protein PilX
MHHTHQRRHSGITTMLVLVFMGVFGMATATLGSYVLTQAKISETKLAREQAFSIAEAGLEYYRWFLAHNPGQVTNPTTTSIDYTVSDPEGADMGTAHITVSGNAVCGVAQALDIEVVGESDANPAYARTLGARYSRQSVAEFSFIINEAVWAGNDRTISGPYHSNGGIRMDATHNSTVVSSVSTWTCTSSFGCSPNQSKPGIFGTGSNPQLWTYPAPQMDFNGISVDLTALKQRAQSSGLFFSGAAGRSGRKGYHLIFQSDGKVRVYKVKNTSYASSIHIDDINGDWYQDYDTITSEDYLGLYTIPSNCPVIFVEDKAWIEGVVKGKVTLAAADLLGGSHDPDLILNGSITYANTNGTDGLTAVAEGSVRYPLVIPTNMTVNGIYIAQKGYYGRNLYTCSYSPYHQRNSLTVSGTVVSNKRVGTKWTYSQSGCGSNAWSGFNTRSDSYDRALATDPPPFTPYASSDNTFTTWREGN